MSRSYRKVPIMSNTCSGLRAGNEKWFKTYTNRQMRRQKLSLPTHTPFSYKNIFTNIWNYPKDGKTFWDNPKTYRK